MKKIVLAIYIIFIFANNLCATQHTVNINGMSYSPAQLDAYIGDTVNIEANAYHPLSQVDQSTWNAGGTTALTGGINNATTTQTLVINSLNPIYYVCVAHASMGMKGWINVLPSTPCDSIIIDSLRFTSTNVISLKANITSFNIGVSYPRFILFNNNADTVAEENVNFFVLGGYTHHLQVINSKPLPMNGYLELHSGWGDSLICTFNVILNDTMLTQTIDYKHNKWSLYPNPTKGEFNIEFSEPFSGRLELYNCLGKMIHSELIDNSNKTNIELSQDTPSGIYIIKQYSLDKNWLESKQIFIY